MHLLKSTRMLLRWEIVRTGFDLLIAVPPRRLLCESSGASRLVSCGLQASLVCIAILVQIFFRASLAPSS